MRKPKTKYDYLYSAAVATAYSQSNEEAAECLNSLWRIAFKRGHAKGVKDERDRPKVTRVITKYVTGSPPITNAREM